MDKYRVRASPKAQQTDILTPIIWPNHMLSITHDRTRYSMIDYQDSITTMDELYFIIEYQQVEYTVIPEVRDCS